MSTYISSESTLPRWNYKKAEWILYRQLTDQVTKDIRVEDRDINKVVKDFNVGIVTAAHKSIPRRARRNYKPYWSEELERLDEQLSAVRRKLKPTHHKTITVTYNIPRPDFSGTSYTPGGKAGETKQHHSTWRKMVASCGD